MGADRNLEVGSHLANKLSEAELGIVLQVEVEGRDIDACEIESVVDAVMVW